MTTNLSNQITSKSHKDLSKFNMIVNEPQQSHFSAEGVQIYTIEDLQNLKKLSERKQAQLRSKFPQGNFLKPRKYIVQFDETQIQKLTTPIKYNRKGIITQQNAKMVKLDKVIQKQQIIKDKIALLQQHKNKTLNKSGNKKVQTKNQSYKVQQQIIESNIHQKSLNQDKQQEKEIQTQGDLSKHQDDFEQIEITQETYGIIDKILSNSEVYNNKLSKAIKMLTTDKKV